MPLIFDQFDTALNVVEKEVGLNIFISDVTAENLGQALHELLTNEKWVYKEYACHMMLLIWYFPSQKNPPAPLQNES